MRKIADMLLGNYRSRSWTTGVKLVRKNCAAFTYDKPFEFNGIVELTEKLLQMHNLKLDKIQLNETNFIVQWF